jgi:hypothetical protein
MPFPDQVLSFSDQTAQPRIARGGANRHLLQRLSGLRRLRPLRHLEYLTA